MLRKNLAELCHHIFEGSLVTGDRSCFWENVFYTEFFKIFFQFGHQNVSKGHRGSTYLGADNLEAPSNSTRSVTNTGVI